LLRKSLPGLRLNEHLTHPGETVFRHACKMGRLVYDESRLNKSRISVSWVSANTWALGSIYGTVEFQFTWADLIADQNIYWVDAMTNYRPNAYRLLLSKRNIQAGPIMVYDPAKDEGPLRLMNGKYYWNYGFTSEFMIEDDLSLDRCTGLTFVTHHEQYCRPFGNGCEDRTKQPSPQRTAGRMLSFILGSGLHILDKHFKPPGANHPFTELYMGYEGLKRFLPTQVQFAGSINADSECQDVVRGSLAIPAFRPGRHRGVASQRDGPRHGMGRKALEHDPSNQRLKNNLDFFIRRREEAKAQ
jgi:hypothetical protein